MNKVLQAAILALPEVHREVLILRDVEGLSAEEAAKVVGIEVRALKNPSPSPMAPIRITRRRSPW